MSASLDQKENAPQKADAADRVSSPFSAACWVAMGEVVGDSAAASLLQFMARTAATSVVIERGHPPGLLAALTAAAEGVPFTFAIVSEGPNRVELTWDHAVLARLPPSLRIAFTRGLFQGILASTPAGAGWGVMVMEDRPAVTLTRGIT